MARRRNSVLASLEVLLGARPDMTLTLCRVFLYVAENPGLSVVELACLCGFTEATASRSAGVLSGGELPLVQVAPSPIDGRSVAIRLTDAGVRLVKDVDRRIAAMITVDLSFSREIGAARPQYNHTTP